MEDAHGPLTPLGILVSQIPQALFCRGHRMVHRFDLVRRFFLFCVSKLAAGGRFHLFSPGGRGAMVTSVANVRRP